MSEGRVPILYIAPWVDLGGSDKGTIDWFKHVDRKRWAPSLIATQPSPNRWLHQVEPFAEEVWELPDLMPGASFPEFILGFIESRDVRLVHIMNSRLGFDLLPDMACLPTPPVVVVQMHAEEPNQAGYVRYVTRRYGNLIDAFSVTSEHLKETVVDYEIPPSRVETIHSGVDGKREFDPGRVEPLPLGGDVPRILWPGRLVEQKDPMLTLDVLARVRERGTKFVLDVVGDGYMKPAVQARADELGLAEAIEWHRPSQEMPRWYASADLMLMTSVYEGVPYVIYESLAMGVPVVAPAIPGNLEFMDADSGALVDPRDDAERYAEAIVGLLGDAERRAKLGERSRKRMLDEFSLEEMGRRHDELYERLLASRPAGSRWRSDELFGGAEVETDKGDGSVAPEPLRLPRDPAAPRTVGVIVPCYRHGIFLDACIESIKAQTLSAARIVVVDDGSEDPETAEALAKLDRDPDVTVLRLPTNSGPSAARNRGLVELDTSYMLPIDADDELLPDALERMLAKLERAPEDIGFVYPHAQHFGNRSDFVQLPAYNLWLLMQENYCPAPALFDRRLFEAGISYPEDIVVGHEDWDLILQLAERGVRGVHADGPTFRYRRQGFSRINAVDYGPDAFHEAIERRHPRLYRRRDAIKAAWAPALSIVLLGDEAAWGELGRTGLERQTCRDFELIAGEPLRQALRQARGGRVVLLGPDLAPMLDSPSFVEQLLYGFVAHEGVSAIVLGEAPGVRKHAFSQLDDQERLAARPLGIAFERLPLGLTRFDLGEKDAVASLAVALQANGTVQWRAAGAPEQVTVPNGESRTVLSQPGEIDIGLDRLGDDSDLAMRISVVHQPPRLPELTAGTVRRWERSEAWIPPGAQPLCRHTEVDGEHRVISNDREPPPGFVLEFELGAVQVDASPGMRRLVLSDQEFELDDEQGELGAHRHGYGYVEQQPLPLLEHLELRRLPGTGQQILVAGPDDPLFAVAEPLATLGWIEARPILPRRNLLHRGPWGVDVLCRDIEQGRWRHRYLALPAGAPTEGTALGSLLRHGREGLVALRLRSDGRLATEDTRAGRASRHPAKLGRWVASPLVRGRKTRSRGAAAEVGARLRHIAVERKLIEDERTTLGWLHAEGAPGCSPLFSATHPLTGDQLVTCSLRELDEHGYALDGVLGHILDTGSDRLA